jgi:hypothetical protein
MSEYSNKVQKARGGDKGKAPASQSSTRNAQKAQKAPEGKIKDKAPVLVLRPSVESFRSDSSSVYSVQSESSVSAALSKYMRGQQEAYGGITKIPIPADKALQSRASDASIVSAWAPILPATAYAPASPYDQARHTTQQHKRHDSAVSTGTIDSQAAVLESQVEYLNLQLQIERMSTVKDFDKEREELKLQLAAAKGRFERINAEADQMDDELHDMHRELNVLHNKNVDQAEKIVCLQARIKDLEFAVRECKKCNELQAKVDKLEMTALVSTKRLDHMAKQIIQKDHNNQSLEEKINELKDQRAGVYATQLAALEQGGKTLREQLRAKEHAEVDFQAKVRLLKMENAALKKQMENLQDQNQNQCKAAGPDPNIVTIAALKQENAGLEKQVERTLVDDKKQCAELGAANLVKVEGLDIRIEALEKEARRLRKQLRAQEETDVNAEAEEMACLAMQQVADAQAEVAEMKQTNITLEKLVSRLQGQLNADQPDLNRAIIEALEQQNSATIVQLAEAVDEMLSMKSTVLHHQRKAECLQKQIDDAERMKDRIEAEHTKILEPIASSIPPEPISSMPVYASYKSKPALLAFSMITTVESLPVEPAKKVSFAISMTLSGVTAIDTEPMESLSSFEDDKPILISVQITPSNPAR